MDAASIVLKIEKGLINCGQQYGVDTEMVRFRLMFIETDKLRCYLYEGFKPFATNGKPTTIDIKKAFNISMLENLFVEPYLKKKLKELAIKNNIDESNVSVFIFKKSDTIIVNLLDGNKTLKEISINEFLK